MGARQSKRSVDISVTPKKGDQENGTIAAAEEKLEKISEGESVVAKVNANGSTTTTSTLTAEQQEAALVSTEIETTPSKSDKEQPAEKTEDAAETPSEEKEELSSPASPSEPTEEGGSEKKKKSKKKWSFRSWSFSKKDRVKPNSKEDKQETVPEDNEAATQPEQVNPEVTNVSCVQNEEPPPLPSSPPPTPAEETPAEKEETPVEKEETPAKKEETPVEKEETPTISEGDVDASGGGEGLAELIEDAELEVTAPVVITVAEKLAETIEEVETKLAAVAAPVVDKVAESIEDAVASVAELKISTTPVPAVVKHVEQDEDGECKITSQLASVVKQSLTNGVVEVNGSVELNGNAEVNGKADL